MPHAPNRSESGANIKFAPLSLLFCVYGMQPIKRSYLRSGRKNLAALGTTTGQNLAAVGSSHSLTETVNLGTVTAAGLVGTLHSDTPPMMKFYAQYRQRRHSNPCFYGTNIIVPMYYNRKPSAGQPLFSQFSRGIFCPQGSRNLGTTSKDAQTHPYRNRRIIQRNAVFIDKHAKPEYSKVRSCERKCLHAENL